MPATCLNPGMGGDLCSFQSRGWWGRLVPAVIHYFFYSTAESVWGPDSSEAAECLLPVLV
jgi:hypothetical protein